MPYYLNPKTGRISHGTQGAALGWKELTRDEVKQIRHEFKKVKEVTDKTSFATTATSPTQLKRQLGEARYQQALEAPDIVPVSSMAVGSVTSTASVDQTEREKQLEQKNIAQAQQTASRTAVQKAEQAEFRAQKTEADKQLTIEEKKKEPLKIYTPEPQTDGRRSAMIRPKILYSDIVQTLYDKSNFPSQEDMQKALKENGLNAKQKFRANTIGEALTRFAYALTETIGGGLREASLGLTGSIGVEKRPGGELYQIAGAVATPTALDYAAGAVLAKIAPLKNGKKILQKIDEYFYPDNLWANKQLIAKQARFWEMEGAVGKLTTSELRDLKKVIKTLNLEEAKPFISSAEFKTLKQISDEAEKRGVKKLESILSKLPDETLHTADFPVKSNWDVYRNAVKKLTIKPRKFVPLDEILTPQEYALWRKQFTTQGIDWDTARNLDADTLKKLVQANLKYLDENKKVARLTQINQLYDESIDALGWYDDSYIDMLKKYGDGLDIDKNILVAVLVNAPPRSTLKALEDVADYSISKTAPILVDNLKKAQETVTDTGIIEGTTPDDDYVPIYTPPKETTETITITEPILEPSKPELIKDLEPEPEPEPEPDSSRGSLSVDELRTVRRNLKGFESPAQYRVTVDGTAYAVTARGYPDAVNRALRQRGAKRMLPQVIDVERIG